MLVKFKSAFGPYTTRIIAAVSKSDREMVSRLASINTSSYALVSGAIHMVGYSANRMPDFLTIKSPVITWNYGKQTVAATIVDDPTIIQALDNAAAELKAHEEYLRGKIARETLNRALKSTR